MRRAATSLTVLALSAFSALAFGIGVIDVGSTPGILTVDDDGPADFHRIQDAINAANDGDVISVSSGTYHESLYVGNFTRAKRFAIIGENEYTTIIDADANYWGLWLDSWYSSKVNISQVTIRNAKYGIGRSTGGVAFVENCIVENCSVGVDFYQGSTIVESVLRDNDLGIAVNGGNMIFHNDFLNNTKHASAEYGSSTWDNGSQSGGNYWDDYAGSDSNGDDIGDNPYDVAPSNRDNYPLVIPWRSPKVADVLRTPIAPEYDEEVTLAATITDRTGIDEAILSYNFGFGWHNLSMNYEGNQFHATVPMQAYGVVVKHKIYAKNNRGLWIASRMSSYTVSDFKPPDVGVSRTPVNPSSVEPVRIHANATEPNSASGIRIVHFSYRVNNGPLWNTTMTFNGTLGLYECTIPPQLSGDVVRYFAEATDNAGNTKIIPEQSYTVVNAGEPWNTWQFPAIVLVAVVGASLILTTYIYHRSRKSKP